MKLFRSVGRVAKPFVNFPEWMGVKTLMRDGRYIKDMAKNIVKKRQPERTETFDQAIKRLKLTEADLRTRKLQFLISAIVCCVIAIATLFYAEYHFSHDHIAAGFITIVLALVAFGTAFRQHFWYFQIKQRRLGCTWKDWWAFLAGGKK